MLFVLQIRNGHIKRITDNDIQSLVLEIVGVNVSTTYITCPADPKKTLGIKLSYLVMIVKNLSKYFTFEVQVRFRSINNWLWVTIMCVGWNIYLGLQTYLSFLIVEEFLILMFLILSMRLFWGKEFLKNG